EEVLKRLPVALLGRLSQFSLEKKPGELRSDERVAVQRRQFIHRCIDVLRRRIRLSEEDSAESPVEVALSQGQGAGQMQLQIFTAPRTLCSQDPETTLERIVVTKLGRS